MGFEQLKTIYEIQDKITAFRAAPPFDDVAGQCVKLNDLYGELFDFIQPGQAWRLYYGVGNGNNKKIHIRGKVDDYIVVRFYRRGGWRYQLENIYFFSTGIESGSLSLVNK